MLWDGFFSDGLSWRINIDASPFWAFGMVSTHRTVCAYVVVVVLIKGRKNKSDNMVSDG